jgi:hypothetical protein
MAFWSTETTEPRRKYRWQVIFSPPGANGQLSGLIFALKKTDKPKGKVNSTTHKYLNHNFNYPGRWEWEDINMTIASVTKPDATRLINEVLINSGYGVPFDASSGAQISTLGKRKFNGALGAFFEIRQLNPDGAVIENWKVVNPFFTSVNYGDLDYSSEDIVDITVGVKYDYAQLLPSTIKDETLSTVNPGFPGKTP